LYSITVHFQLFQMKKIKNFQKWSTYLLLNICWQLSAFKLLKLLIFEKVSFKTQSFVTIPYTPILSVYRGISTCDRSNHIFVFPFTYKFSEIVPYLFINLFDARLSKNVKAFLHRICKRHKDEMSINKNWNSSVRTDISVCFWLGIGGSHTLTFFYLR